MLSLPCTAYDRILLCLFLVFLTLFWPFLSFQIHPKEIHPDNVLIGFHNRKYYIAYNPASEGKFDIKREIKAFLVINHSLDISKQQERQDHVEMGLRQEEGHRSSRVCAKIMLNTAAYLYGQEFVMRPEFNLVREWILEGKHADIFFRLPYIDENTTLKKIDPFPKKRTQSRIKKPNKMQR